MKSFTDHIIDYAQELESPTSFWRWASYTAVGAILRDNVYKFQGTRNLYPNIYCILLADSASHRKSVPVDLAVDLIRSAANTKLISGRNSIQSVIDDLATTETHKKTGHQIRGGSCLLCAHELASFIVDDPAAIKILTDIYDFRESWDYSLRGTGKVKVNNLCVSFLAASNETFLRDVYNKSAVYGGLLGRTFMVTPNEFRNPNDLLDMSRNRYDKEELFKLVKEIAKLKGEVDITNDAKEEYRNWYYSLRKSYSKRPDRTGVLGRIHTGVLKLSMIIGVSTNYELTVTKHDMEESIHQCTELLPNYEAYAVSTGKSSLSEIGAAFLNDMWRNKDRLVTRKEFLRNHWADCDSVTLDSLTVTLEQAGMIIVTTSNNAVAYQMTDKCAEMFEGKKGSTMVN